ncbi:MAG: precorrin-6y C5,15-methyltransferase (decarboxylating) subunit CbiE [Rhodospirillales bacterium]
MTAPWLSIIGVGDDGLAGLSPSARGLIDRAEVIAGAARHLAMVGPEHRAERIEWTDSVLETAARLPAYAPRRVCVLATGDPMWFGAGVAVCRHVPADQRVILPAPGAFSLLAARMGWPLADVETVTLHGRPLQNLALSVYPCARILALSRGAETPAAAARLLCDLGYPESEITVFEHMGGGSERRMAGCAEGWDAGAVGADLNAFAVLCVAGPGAVVRSRAPGLPDDAFEHGGTITKREVRAATLAKLAPSPGEMLLDIGLGAGSVAVEWLRLDRRNCAAGIESNPARAATALRNAGALGVPRLHVIEGAAPEALAEVRGAPDAVFIGGGASAPGVMQAAWEKLRPGGRFAANAVTLEARAKLTDAHAQWGGELTEISVSRSAAVGGFTGLKPLMPVLQYAVQKPSGGGGA